MLKREIRRNFNKYGKYLEPLEVLALLILFALPVLAVINLSPQTGEPPSLDDDVLGLTTSNETAVEEVGGIHEFIKDEHLYTKSSTEMEYQATLMRRDPGIYTKPILSINNPSSEDLTVRFTLVESEASTSQIGIMRSNVNYILKDASGEKFFREFVLEPGDDLIFHIDVRDQLKKNFEETLQIEINLYGLEPEEPVDEQLLTDTESEIQEFSGNEIKTNVPIEESESPTDQDPDDSAEGSELEDQEVLEGSNEGLEQYDDLVELQ